MHTDGTRRLDGSETVDFENERYTSYRDGNGRVIVDRRNPAAWVRSTVVRPCVR
ncbi:hypothetical protein Natpe_3308 [Natrinema pellirubrum DSM 15624]|uniref:Uncharacterized protein n=1 Tax=Natrinema pellirubrum (strain DSM 15624 / CIP 106293 / JCM 10476 / NCIMB 786 / 157) TaxID=797303 RepID=L0JNI4_NATP1|nr:hypothetical protein [Natrinema pellirubrum]AGB33095.1 hypothetical protein Natpe_3308 [Natrinema pellirubrum DSM 15624]